MNHSFGLPSCAFRITSKLLSEIYTGLVDVVHDKLNSSLAVLY